MVEFCLKKKKAITSTEDLLTSLPLSPGSPGFPGEPGLPLSPSEPS